MTQKELSLRLIGDKDYGVVEDGRIIGRIRYAKERTPELWVWNVTIATPGPPDGDAQSFDEAKQRLKKAWLAFKERIGPERLAKAYETMDHANRPDRYAR